MFSANKKRKKASRENVQEVRCRKKQGTKATRKAIRREIKAAQKNTEKLNAKQKKNIKANAAPKNSVQLIGYQRMLENGICMIEPGVYSRP